MRHNRNSRIFVPDAMGNTLSLRLIFYTFAVALTFAIMDDICARFFRTTILDEPSVHATVIRYLCYLVFSIIVMLTAKSIILADYRRNVPPYGLLPAEMLKWRFLQTTNLQSSTKDTVEGNFDFCNLPGFAQELMTTFLIVQCSKIHTSLEDSLLKAGLPNFDASRQVKVSVFMPASASSNEEQSPIDRLRLVAGSASSMVVGTKAPFFLSKHESLAGRCWQTKAAQLGGPRDEFGAVDPRWDRTELWSDHRTSVCLCLPLLDIGPSRTFLGVLSISFSRDDIVPLKVLHIFDIVSAFTLASDACVDTVISTLRQLRAQGYRV